MSIATVANGERFTFEIMDLPHKLDQGAKVRFVGWREARSVEPHRIEPTYAHGPVFGRYCANDGIVIDSPTDHFYDFSSSRGRHWMEINAFRRVGPKPIDPKLFSKLADKGFVLGLALVNLSTGRAPFPRVACHSASLSKKNPFFVAIHDCR
jgi:hypothetical protein